MKNRFTLVTLVLFLALTGVFYWLNGIDKSYSFSLLMTGNGIMAVLSLLTFYMVRKTMNDRPEAFVRGVYGATFLKLMVCMASILLYALLNRETLHKPSLFILFGIYAVYTAFESWFLSKMARSAK